MLYSYRCRSGNGCGCGKQDWSQTPGPQDRSSGLQTRLILLFDEIRRASFGMATERTFSLRLQTEFGERFQDFSRLNCCHSNDLLHPLNRLFFAHHVAMGDIRAL